MPLPAVSHAAFVHNDLSSLETLPEFCFHHQTANDILEIFSNILVKCPCMGVSSKFSKS